MVIENSENDFPVNHFSFSVTLVIKKIFFKTPNPTCVFSIFINHLPLNKVALRYAWLKLVLRNQSKTQKVYKQAHKRQTDRCRAEFDQEKNNLKVQLRRSKT